MGPLGGEIKGPKVRTVKGDLLWLTVKKEKKIWIGGHLSEVDVMNRRDPLEEGEGEGEVVEVAVDHIDPRPVSPVALKVTWPVIVQMHRPVLGVAL
jgi:hypothetical protein